MPPWLSSGVFRCGVVLTLGWAGLAGMAVMVSGTLVQSGEAGPPRSTSGNAIELDELDPCTQDRLAIDARLPMTATVRLSGDLIHTDLLVAFYGSLFMGSNRLEQRVALADHVGFVRTLSVGLLDPYDLTLRIVERPAQPDTLLSTRLQPFWNGTSEALTLTETHLMCA